MKNEPIATGKVVSLSVNGEPLVSLPFKLSGPVGDRHSGLERRLSVHDGTYIKTSCLAKGDTVFNWRTWTALSQEEIAGIESKLGLAIPQGCLLENMVISGIPGFSKLKPTTRLVFQPSDASSFGEIKVKRPVLAVWEENGPCKVVGKRLEEHHNKPRLKTDFVAAARNRRGLMGLVLAEGTIEVGDTVFVYPPVGRQTTFQEKEKAYWPIRPYSWWKFLAPVVPPGKVVSEVRETGRYVIWNNFFWSGKVAAAMFYYTRLATKAEREWYDDEVVTHLLPGSPTPAKGWLWKVPYAIRMRKKPDPNS